MVRVLDDKHCCLHDGCPCRTYNYAWGYECNCEQRVHNCSGRLVTRTDPPCHVCTAVPTRMAGTGTAYCHLPLCREHDPALRTSGDPSRW
jgi:hypothetical protein